MTLIRNDENNPINVRRAGDDQHRELTLLASAARTASVNTTDETNRNARGVHVAIQVTSTTGGTTALPSVTPTIQAKDPVSGAYYDLLAGSAITSTGITILKVYPGITVAANLSASDIVPRTWRLSIVHASTEPIIYSAGAAELQ